MRRVKYTLFYLLALAVMLFYWCRLHRRFDHGVRKKFFFVESSPWPELNFRQACAIESAARHHPNSDVTVFTFSSNVTKEPVDLSGTLRNVNIVKQTFEALFAGTLLAKWYKKGDWKRSHWRISHLSDAARFTLIWKYGGIYLDLDVVVLKPLHGMKNFLIRQSSDLIAAGILGFEPKHPLISECLRSFDRVYRPTCFPCVGPVLVTKAFKLFCGVKSLDDVKAKNCSVAVYSPTTAFPVSWRRWKDYFDKNKRSDVLRKAKSSRMIHVWNKISSKRRLSLHSGSAYEEIMKRHCPIVYQHLTRNSLDF